jgi:hypothetical protein
MDIQTFYSLRTAVRPPLDDAIQQIISKLKISFKPAFRRPAPVKRPVSDDAVNWRAQVLINLHRKVRDKDDADYDEINACLNKLTKQSYAKMMGVILDKLAKRDEMFRLRVTTLLFDRGCTQTFFAPLMADAYGDISKVYPDAMVDLLTQVSMFDTLYAVSNVTIVPKHTDPGYDDAIIAWTKQKEKKRTFAVYIAELFGRGLIPQDIMATLVKTVLDDLKEAVRHTKTPEAEEHVDSLVRFVFAVAAKVPEMRVLVKEILAIPRPETTCLNMKSRFKLEDSLKL